MNIRVFDICWGQNRQDLPCMCELEVEPSFRKLPLWSRLIKYGIGAKIAEKYEAIPVRYKYVIGNSAKVWKYEEGFCV